MGRELFAKIVDQTRAAWARPPAYWRVLYTLAALAEENDLTIVTIPRLAELTGVSVRRVETIMEALKREGFVTVVERHRGPASPNVYRVQVPDGWKLPADS